MMLMEAEQSVGERVLEVLGRELGEVFPGYEWNARSKVRDPGYWRLVPTDLIENLKFRRRVLMKCAEDKEYRSAMRQACQEDVLFFLSVFCWIYEPRDRFDSEGRLLPKEIPFIPWSHQTPRIMEIRANLGVRDIGVEKSRGEGASWIGVLLAVDDFLHDARCKVSLVSKDADSVDKLDDMDSLMEKMSWELEMLPIWMTGRKRGVAGEFPIGWKRSTSDSVIFNVWNRSAVTGFASGEDVASGGRAKWILFDELAKFPPGKDRAAMASTQHVTDSRFFPSTPKGASGSYYDLMHRPSSMLKVKFHWTDNPTKNAGLYRMQRGIPEAVDSGNPLPSDYDPMSTDVVEMLDSLRSLGFKVDTTLRSPWYDNECFRGEATPQNIAQELDLDYGGSAYLIFDTFFTAKMEETVREPLHLCEMDFDYESLEPEIKLAEKGDLKLWIPLAADRRSPQGRFVIGADVSNGQGGTFSSASTLCVFNSQTSEQVAEWSNRLTPPGEMALVAIAIAKWFNNAYFAWEDNGPGGGLKSVVMRRGYQNIYYREMLGKKKRVKGTTAGWHTSEESKEAMFADFDTAVKHGKIILRSRRLLAETGNYIRKNGKIFHALIPNANDDASGVSHGDLVIAACVARQALLRRPRLSDAEWERQAEKEAPEGSFLRRNQEFETAEATKHDQWDDEL